MAVDVFTLKESVFVGNTVPRNSTMDYGTFFFTNIASVTVFAVCLSMLAVYQRTVIGLRWFAGALVVGLVKLILQGLEGHAPVILTSMLANQLYLVSFAMQFLGFHWFVVGKPFRARWHVAALAANLVLYTVLYLCKVPYTANLINVPFVALCGISAWFLLRHGQGTFRMLSRCTAAVLVGDMFVSGYRALLTNMRYMRPWETANAHTDPRWLYSLAAMAFLATFMAMCYLWFLVAEMSLELEKQALTDSLTGSLNRRAMEEIALRETARSIRYGHPLCMIMIDIDNFKHLNDTRGHAAGDCALQALASGIRSLLRTGDHLARTGGEEFAVLLPNTCGITGMRVAERLCKAVEDLEIGFESGPLRITISAGVTQLTSGHDGWEAMMRRADAAMYAAKQHGRNQVSADLASEAAAGKP
jgi:diguanylate cyclase (GGDEF)-like protein